MAKRRYYLLAGYLIPYYPKLYSPNIELLVQLQTGSVPEKTKYYLGEYSEIPRSFMLHKIDTDNYIKICYYDVDQGLIVLKAESMKLAYQIANAIWGCFSICFHLTPNPDRLYSILVEIDKLPKSSWKFNNLVETIQSVDPECCEFWLNDLRYNVQIILRSQLQTVRDHLPIILNNQNLINAIQYLLQSKSLHYGSMPGSYYMCHYRYERLNIPEWERNKVHLEHHTRYEEAFVSAFKAIECFFGVSQIKKRNIDKIVDETPYTNINSTSEYRRLFEIFDKQPKLTTYSSLIQRFLDIRNAVGAHANIKPPEHLQISADTVCEIQHFIKCLYLNVIEDANNYFNYK